MFWFLRQLQKASKIPRDLPNDSLVNLMGKAMGSTLLIQYFVNLNLIKSVNLLCTYNVLQNSKSQTRDCH